MLCQILQASNRNQKSAFMLRIIPKRMTSESLEYVTFHLEYDLINEH